MRGVIEKKSLLPRMIYLSIHSASASLKESVEENGSISGSKISSEFKFLLERHAKMLGFSLSDAVEVVMGVSSGVKSFEVYLCCQSYSLLFLTALYYFSWYSCWCGCIILIHIQMRWYRYETHCCRCESISVLGRLSLSFFHSFRCTPS